MTVIRAFSVSAALTVGLMTSASAQAPCPSCQPCSAAAIVHSGSVGPIPTSGNGSYPSVRVPTFNVSLGTLTGVQVSVTAEAMNRVYRAEYSNPNGFGSYGDPSNPASLSMIADVKDPSSSVTILHVDPSIDPDWEVQDVFPSLATYDCCTDFGVCDNDPGPGFDFQCCPGCPIPINTGPVIPPSCPSTAPPPCTTPAPQASGYHRSFANSAFSVTTTCITSNLSAYLSSTGSLVAFPVFAISPENTGSSIGGSTDKHWSSKLRVTVRVAYTYCPSGAPAFCPICFGDNALVPCPCNNSGLPAHGCNNSASTGGARLSGAGTTSPDTVILTSSGELASALSMVFQGDAVMTQPATFGDGLRCIGGTLLRLYTQSAVNGSVSAPSGGDPSISARSASLGDPIAPGSTRSYQTYYRDPDPAFCPAPNGNTWNVSSGLTITW